MKRTYKPAVLKNRNGDLRLQWYVEYWPWSEKNQKPVRQSKTLSGKYHWPFIIKILKHASILNVAREFFVVHHDKAGIYFKHGPVTDRQVIELDLENDTFQSLTHKNVKGDVIQLLMKFNDMTFIDSVEWLGGFYNLLVNRQVLEKEDQRRIDVGKGLVTEINAILLKGMKLKDTSKDRPLRQRTDKLSASFKDAWTVALKGKLKSVSSGSVGNYKSVGNLFIDYLDEYGETSLGFEKIDSEHVLGFLDWCQEVYGITNTTRNNRLSILSAIFTHMRNLGYKEKGSDHPCHSVAYEKAVKRKNYAFNRLDRDAIFNHLWEHDKQLFLACSLIYYLFIRINEMRNLKVERFNWLEKNVFIRPENKTYRPRYPVISEGLEELLDSLDFKNWEPKHYVFSKKGQPGRSPIHKDSLSSRFREVLVQLDIDPNFHNLYSMKHTGNIDSFNAKVSLESLRQQNGHTNVATTVEYLKELGAKFDDNLSGKQPKLNLNSD